MSSLVGRFGCPTRLAYRVDCLLNPYSCQHSTSWCSWKQTPWTASVMGAVGPGGHGRASRSTTPSRRLACGDLAGGRARRHPTLRHHTTTSSRGQQARGRRAQTPRAASVAGGRARRARAGFEIDHSEPQTRVWRSCGRPGPEAPDTQALLTDTSMSREKRGPVRTGNRVPSGGPRPGWRPPRLCPGRPGVPQPARSRGGRR